MQQLEPQSSQKWIQIQYILKIAMCMFKTKLPITFFFNCHPDRDFLLLFLPSAVSIFTFGTKGGAEENDGDLLLQLTQTGGGPGTPSTFMVVKQVYTQSKEHPTCSETMNNMKATKSALSQ